MTEEYLSSYLSEVRRFCVARLSSFSKNSVEVVTKATAILLMVTAQTFTTDASGERRVFLRESFKSPRWTLLHRSESIRMSVWWWVWEDYGGDGGWVGFMVMVVWWDYGGVGVVSLWWWKCGGFVYVVVECVIGVWYLW